MSAESGIKTFRDSGGLWEEYDVMTVASIDGWYKDPELVLRFYNERRRQLETAKPNAGHFGLAELQKYFDVYIITQNVDNLHERAGSKLVLHLHGELTKVRGVDYPSTVYDIGYKDIHWGDKCEQGSQLRPHIVWFGEAVPEIEKAERMTLNADLFLIIGTSMQVYPAAGLINNVKPGVPIYLIDPHEVNNLHDNITIIQKGASEGMNDFKKILLTLPVETSTTGL